MPGISNDEKQRRLAVISDLLKEDKTDYAIAKETGMSLMAVKRNITYLKDLSKADLTPEDLAEKRSEIYVELIEATEEAKKLFEYHKKPFKCPTCDGTGIIEVVVAYTEKGVVYNVGDRKVCKVCKGLGLIHNAKDAERFLRVWVEVIDRKASIFGLDKVKGDSLVINQQFNTGNLPTDKISGKTAEAMNKIAKSIIKEHEDSVQ